MQGQRQILNAYLAGGIGLVSKQLSDAEVRAGVQVFILGMADMLRQAEKLSFSDLVSLFHAVLMDHNLLPELPTEDFIDRVGKAAATNDDVAKLMSMGAQSIQMYVGERDAQAPTDLLGVPHFVNKHRPSFSQIVLPDPTVSTVELLSEAKGFLEEERHIEAISCWNRAAERESAEAQYYLWKMHLEGWGGLDNFDTGVSYLKKAAEQGYGPAELKLATYYAEQLIGEEGYAERAIYWGKRAFEHGCFDAAQIVGNMYAVERPGVKRDDVEAFGWFLKAAEYGDAYSQYQIGVSYEHGLGADKNIEDARNWYKMAKDSGYQIPQDSTVDARNRSAEAKARRLAMNHLRKAGRVDLTLKAASLPSPGVYGFNPSGWTIFCVCEKTPTMVRGDEFIGVNLTTGDVQSLGIIGD